MLAILAVMVLINGEPQLVPIMDDIDHRACVNMLRLAQDMNVPQKFTIGEGVLTVDPHNLVCVPYREA